MSGKKGMKIKKRKPMSQETRKQISKIMKNKWKEKEYRESMCDAHKHELTEEWKKNISKGMKGKKKKKSTRVKMSNYHSDRPKEHEENIRKGWKEQWNSLTKAQQLERISNWIEAGHKSFSSFSLKPTSIEIKVKE